MAPDTPIKLAFLIEHLDPNRGGMERSAADYLTEIAALGVEAHVITQTSADVPAGVHVHALGMEGWTDELQYRNFVSRADHFVAGGRWDIVHAIRPCLRCDVYQPRGGLVRVGQERTVAARRGLVARLLKQAGQLFHGKDRLLIGLERRLLSGANPPLVVVPSDYVGRQVERTYGLSGRSLRRVFNGVRVREPLAGNRRQIRLDYRRRLGIAAQERVAIFVGHNFRRKGLARVMDAMALSEGQGWRLLVVGRGAIGYYQRYAQQQGLADRVQFLGGRDDVAELYWASDACLLPTYNDPCSRTVLEALSLGVPCVTTSFDGSSECIRDGETGFVVESPDQVPMIARALQQLGDDRVLGAMSAKASDLASVLSMRRHARELFGLYHEIVARRAQAEALCPA
ncbi:MAG: glycosyltransferase family 4 protein [Nitrospiraceae bacterium]|nr:glycosyltransferase family 4 protein [Nitrospiraceae bacterium]